MGRKDFSFLLLLVDIDIERATYEYKDLIIRRCEGGAEILYRNGYVYNLASIGVLTTVLLWTVTAERLERQGELFGEEWIIFVGLRKLILLPKLAKRLYPDVDVDEQE